MTSSEQRHSSDISYRIMASYLKFRERFRKPQDFLESVGISPGDVILDHGCGIGSYAIPAAKIVGPTGKVYALDIHHIAVEKTAKRAKQAGLNNLELILSGLENGLPDQSVDTILLIDVYTWIPDKLDLLKEFHRTLRSKGRLVILIDHDSPEGCKKDVERSGFFKLERQEENVLFYSKQH